ncbi:tetratricopeptide repeat protein [Persicimonas caeni]|uniref:Tetratricopeptide repeat protein n=1 Tax=Persicimonas caeni TaxID=2292766 RepID=A0A4Y6PSG6_PERCE|nr:tetratricopeptide repeat protein [Persicimonas caeni]QDG51190.1 tetratricopeptide repeat protein [Persicimonas caeni]QED32411.1 tetratricopeptide repeat protein [Persicimonas caeni]
MKPHLSTTWQRLLALAVAAAVLTTTAYTFAEEDESKQQEAQKPDYVALAAMLVQDGHYDRAQLELAKVDTSEGSDFDRKTYYTLEGIISLKKKDYQSAVDHLDDAIRYGKVDDMMFVYLAQAYYGLRNWERTILSVRNAEEAGEKIPDLFLMKAHAHRELDQNQQAWSTLRKGAKRFPDKVAFLRQQVFLLVEMGLYRQAADLGEVFLGKADSGVEDYLALGEAFRRAGAHDRAKHLLEEAKLRFPQNQKVLVHLAHAYIATGHLITAGEFLQQAAEFDKKYVLESAELYRRAGAFERALYMNSQVEDQKKKFKQRVAILLDRKQFERIASLEMRLSRLGLLDDQDEQSILYTLAYARFQTGDYEDAERLLKRVTDAQLFESAVQLRKTVQMCQQEPSGC